MFTTLYRCTRTIARHENGPLATETNRKADIRDRPILLRRDRSGNESPCARKVQYCRCHKANYNLRWSADGVPPGDLANLNLCGLWMRCNPRMQRSRLLGTT